MNNPAELIIVDEYDFNWGPSNSIPPINIKLSDLRIPVGLIYGAYVIIFESRDKSIIRVLKNRYGRNDS